MVGEGKASELMDQEFQLLFAHKCYAATSTLSSARFAFAHIRGTGEASPSTMFIRLQYLTTYAFTVTDGCLTRVLSGLVKSRGGESITI